MSVYLVFSGLEYFHGSGFIRNNSFNKKENTFFTLDHFQSVENWTGIFIVMELNFLEIGSILTLALATAVNEACILFKNIHPLFLFLNFLSWLIYTKNSLMLVVYIEWKPCIFCRAKYI